MNSLHKNFPSEAPYSMALRQSTLDNHTHRQPHAKIHSQINSRILKKRESHLQPANQFNEKQSYVDSFSLFIKDYEENLNKQQTIKLEPKPSFN